MKTFGSVLEGYKGIGPGFDTMRIVLAFAVIAWHCIPIALGSADSGKHSHAWVLWYSVLPVFFALSGFLVAGSALRLSLGKFALSRALRIIPALVVDTLVTIVLIAPFFTTLSLVDFFSNIETAKYLLNIIGKIQFTLPGVFESNPYANIVNGSLWTIGPELLCYLVMGFLIFSSWIKSSLKVAFIFILVSVYIIVAYWVAEHFELKGEGFIIHAGWKLLIAFLAGALCFLLRFRIPYSPSLFVGVVIVFVLFILFVPAQWDNSVWIVVSMPLFVYVMAFLGLTPLPKVPFFDRGDYSYGIYLYGFPIQQAFVKIFDISDPLILFFSVVVPITVLAVFSWHCVEKPALKLRKAFSFSAQAAR